MNNRQNALLHEDSDNRMPNSNVQDFGDSYRPQVVGLRWMMSSKIHKATVTEADVSYVGSITIDEDLLEKSGLLAGEKVLIVSNTNGARLETYTIPGERKSGTICINGAAAHLVSVGHEIIIIGFQLATETLEPKAILLDKENRFVRYL
jgi:aspartate 1-decarboxylase